MEISIIIFLFQKQNEFSQEEQKKHQEEAKKLRLQVKLVSLKLQNLSLQSGSFITLFLTGYKATDLHNFTAGLLKPSKILVLPSHKKIFMTQF